MTEEPLTKGDKRNNKGQFVKGYKGGPGRPVGSVSVITKLKQMFQEDPEDFENFVKRYKKNPNNEKHIAEMIDGKPKQSIDVRAEVENNFNEEQINTIAERISRGDGGDGNSPSEKESN